MLTATWTSLHFLILQYFIKEKRNALWTIDNKHQRLLIYMCVNVCDKMFDFSSHSFFKRRFCVIYCFFNPYIDFCCFFYLLENSLVLQFRGKFSSIKVQSIKIKCQNALKSNERKMKTSVEKLLEFHSNYW